jgi:glycosyltransferase involved in cell wall biosynthesis
MMGAMASPDLKVSERSPRGAAGHAAHPPGRPLVSIVSAVYNVAPYLPEFIESVEAQGDVLDAVEVIAVDDGSTDGSLELLEAWRDRSSIAITVLHQENAGQAVARNAGIEHATGEWVTFSDPDDMLGPGYLDAIRRFAARHPAVQLIAGMPVTYLEETGERLRHARYRQYQGGDRVVNLDAKPNVFSGATHLSFFRLDRLRETGLRFSPLVRPNFEDGHFAVCYVLSLPRPDVGLVRSARYIYRRRAAGTSTIQRSYSDQGRYTAVFEHGYLDVIRRAKAADGRVPAWLQHVLIYELSWYLAEDEKITTPIFIADDVVPVFHEHLAAVLRELDPAVVDAHRVRVLRTRWRYILAHAGRDEPWHSTGAITAIDRGTRLQRLVYRFVGPQPSEVVTIAGHPVEPAWTKTQAHIYYRRPLFHTRVLWVPLDSGVALALDGRPVPIRRARESGLRIGEPEVDRSIDAVEGSSNGVLDRVVGRVTRVARRVGPSLVRRQARSASVRARFRDAWVFMDRPNEADDNGERLFEYVREHRPDINAWFAISPDSADYVRLRSTHGSRVVARGTREFRLLMLNAAWLVSSHADRVVTAPTELEGIITRPTWRYAFLQHGVIKDDLSSWLNKKQASLFVVSTEAELESVAGDGTAYWYTRKETRLTGLPRFDRLLRKADEHGRDARNLVLVAPTWRAWLTSHIDVETFQRDIDSSFWDSEYLHSWMAVLRSPRIAAAAEAAGFTIGFMPHPAMQPILSRLELPPHVRPLTFAGEDVQGLYARAAMLVTDYSSVAFNVAYIDGPIVYFQFDRDAVLSGQHLGRAGYFDYHRDGFGPVTMTADEAIDAIVEQIERGARPAPEYQARIDATFPQRDGHACERVVAAIEELRRPYPWPPDVQAVLDRRRARAKAKAKAGAKAKAR